MRFIRIHGRVVPIHDNGNHAPTERKGSRALGVAIVGSGAAALYGEEKQLVGLTAAKKHAVQAVAAARTFGIKSKTYQEQKSLARAGAKAFKSGQKISRVALTVGLTSLAIAGISAIRKPKKKD